jgi:hypothetical protein
VGKVLIIEGRMKIGFQGKEIEVVEVEPVNANEPWSEYQLADGVVLSIKTVLISVHKALSETNPDGTPLYLTKTHQVIKVK